MTAARYDARRSKFYEDVGRMVRGFRVAEGLTRRELAAQVHVSETHLGQVELGSTACPLYLAAKIAEVLDITIEDLARVTIDKEETSE